MQLPKFYDLLHWGYCLSCHYAKCWEAALEEQYITAPQALRLHINDQSSGALVGVAVIKDSKLKQESGSDEKLILGDIPTSHFALKNDVVSNVS